MLVGLFSQNEFANSSNLLNRQLQLWVILSLLSRLFGLILLLINLWNESRTCYTVNILDQMRAMTLPISMGVPDFLGFIYLQFWVSRYLWSNRLLVDFLFEFFNGVEVALKALIFVLIKDEFYTARFYRTILPAGHRSIHLNTTMSITLPQGANPFDTHSFLIIVTRIRRWRLG